MDHLGLRVCHLLMMLQSTIPFVVGANHGASSSECRSIVVCTKPLTNAPFGSPCGCVRPMQVILSINVPLNAFFSLVQELVDEIALGVFMRKSQIRITGANASTKRPRTTTVFIDLVPLEAKFDMSTVVLTFDRFLQKEIALNYSIFRDYEVLYVHYPGLPPSPLVAPSSFPEMDKKPFAGNDIETLPRKPFGADVYGKDPTNHHRLSGSLIAIISLSAVAAIVLCLGLACVLLLNCKTSSSTSADPTPKVKLPSHLRPSGTDEFMDGIGSAPSSPSLSLKSSVPAYAGPAKTFSLIEVLKATSNFDASNVIGEGGFGVVYKGVLDDGTNVAIKVLKAHLQHGDREFVAEVEMLCRLHHRNLVKLIGICAERLKHCLVYELVPNGSLESHLHGGERRKRPLGWASRVKIALGAARGLAYLHEDSCPSVIHRDFKSANILLEDDFTPKVSDFGLAQATLETDNTEISSRDVFGTFGYIAPEYALTGHFLIKSDVYSYGVVLLELLTGRKPVNMSETLGRENLVAWAQPLLTDKAAQASFLDPSLGSDVPFDSVRKVAAIASMCVQPEVSDRSYMGEVVQALKLVFDETKEAAGISRSGSRENASPEQETGVSGSSCDRPFPSHPDIRTYNSDTDVVERGLSVSDLLDDEAMTFDRQPISGSFRRRSSSGPLKTGRGWQLWSIVRKYSGRSMSDHQLWRGSH